MTGIFGIIFSETENQVLVRTWLENMQSRMLEETDQIAEIQIDKNFGLGIVKNPTFISQQQPRLFTNPLGFGAIEGQIYDAGGLFSIKTTNKFERLFSNDGSKVGKYIADLNGGFNGVIYKRNNKELIIFNDRLGYRPFYFSNFGFGVAFSSELKPLLNLPFVDISWNEKTILEFFLFGFALNDKTWIKNIRRLPPATILQYNHGNLSLTKYWKPNFQEETDGNINDLVDQFIQIFESSFDYHVKPTESPGCLLSGGLDSRLIAAILNKNEALGNLFTLSDGNSLEELYAEKVASSLDTTLNKIHVHPQDFINNIEDAIRINEGQVSVFHLTMALIKDSIAKRVSAIYDGINLLDSFYGYSESFLPEFLFVKKNSLPAKFFFRIFNLPQKKELNQSIQFLDSVLQANYQSRLKQHLKNGVLYSDFVYNRQFANIWRQLNYLDCHYRQRRFTSNGPLFLRHWVDVQMPYLNYPLIDFALKLPVKLRSHNKPLLRKALKRINPRLAEIPLSPDELPAKYTGVYRDFLRFIKKVSRKIRPGQQPPLHWGAIDFDRWLHESRELQIYVTERILDDFGPLSNYFNKSEINRVLEQQFQGVQNNSEFIGNLLTFVIWNQQIREARTNHAQNNVA